MKTPNKQSVENQKIQQLEAKVERLESEVTRLSKNEIFLTARIEQLLSQLFSRKSERYVDDKQPSLFDEADLPLPENVEAEVPQYITVPSHTRQTKPKRTALPAELPREEIIHDISTEEKHCSCCDTELKKIGEEITEQLKVIPSKIVVVKHVRLKYACKQCEQGVKIAAMPKLFLPKTQASAEMVAFTIVQKYQDHLPLYRQQKIWARYKIDVSDNTLGNWVMLAFERCLPLLEVWKNSLLATGYLHADETPLNVFGEKDKANLSKAYMWVYCTGDAEHPIILYDYQASRSAQGVSVMLADYQGYLQTDMYQAYNSMAQQTGIQHIGCLAHARRKFHDIYKVAKNNGKATQALSYIQKLYGIETALKDKAPAERFLARLEKSKPIVDQMHAWLEKSIRQVPAEHAIGKAIQYSLNHWSKLTGFLLDGRLNIDNNSAERAIRPFTIGRKNWMFAGSPRGAQAGALFYSLIETAKANFIDPYEYLCALFNRIPQITNNDYSNLMPWDLCKRFHDSV